MRIYNRHTHLGLSYDIYNASYLSSVKEHPDDVDITTVSTLWEYFRVGRIDYIQFRDYSKTAFLPIWDTLAETDKDFLISHSVRPSGITVPFEDYVKVVELEKKAREARWNQALTVGGYYYFDNDINKLLMYNDCKGYRNDYVEANLPFIVLWLTNGSLPSLGLDFTNTGFNTRTYYTEELKNQLLQCFIK